MKSLLLSPRKEGPDRRVIVGLGNPGLFYHGTRHNIGWRAVSWFAEQHGIAFREEMRFSAFLGCGVVDGVDVSLLLPLTYMNESGRAVQAAVDLLGVSLEKIMVVVDEVALPFGSMRLSRRGSSGGHNGLRSVEDCLGTRTYPRLRLGIGPCDGVPLARYVLDSFSLAQQVVLPRVWQKVAEVLECWIRQGIEVAMGKGNTMGEQDV